MSELSLFNRTHGRMHRRRAAKSFSEYRFLYDWCEEEIVDRLSIIRRSFPVTVLLNDRSSPEFREELEEEKDVSLLISIAENSNADTDISAIADFEILPLAVSSCDLIISILDLHRINDLPGTLIQIRRALRPDGLFISMMFGGETLHQLRSVLLDAELSVSGGASPRVFPFADKQQVGALMQRAGFTLPVVDSDIITVAYRDIFHLMYDLKGMGENNSIAARKRNMTPKSLFIEAQRLYAERFMDAEGKLPASFEIISAIGWAPHDSQPQPLKRGSATSSLATALK